MAETHKIAVGIDFSPTGQRALEAAIALAKDLKAGLVLVHAIPNPAPPMLAAGAAPKLFEELSVDEVQAAAVELTTKWAKQARDDGIEVETAIGLGSPAEFILREAQTHDASMIAVGTVGRTGLKRALLGSVAEAVLRRSPVPVLVVGGKG